MKRTIIEIDEAACTGCGLLQNLSWHTVFRVS